MYCDIWCLKLFVSFPFFSSFLGLIYFHRILELKETSDNLKHPRFFRSGCSARISPHAIQSSAANLQCSDLSPPLLPHGIIPHRFPHLPQHFLLKSLPVCFPWEPEKTLHLEAKSTINCLFHPLPSPPGKKRTVEEVNRADGSASDDSARRWMPGFG